MEDYLSSWSTSAPGSTPHTPVGQAPPPFYSRGLGSSTSLATTDDEEAESQYAWSHEHERLVASVLQEYRNNPHNTPFSGRFPPSGVVQGVARSVIRRAPRGEFPHSLVAVRKRVLLICAREEPEPAPPSPGDAYALCEFAQPQADAARSEYEQFDFSEARSDIGAPLSSPFREEFRQPALAPAPAPPVMHPQQPAIDPHVLNIVAQRKRDSLKMKRGLK